LRTKRDVLSATDRARLHAMRRELKDLLGIMDFRTELFSASATAFRERTGRELKIADPAAHLTEADKLRALELFRASRSGGGTC
jgi:uncharacterized protein YcbX